MERHVLIAGRGGPVLEALVQEAIAAKARVLRTLDSGQDKPPVPEGSEDLLALTIWNRRSPLSARSVVIRAANVLSTIEEAFIVYSSSNEVFRPFHELSPADIELKVDSDVKGYLFLIKEILAQLSRQRSGTISLVFQHPGAVLGSPLEAAAAAGFHSTADELFVAYQNEPVILRGFESTVADASEFARHVFAAGTEKAERTRGKWQRFTGKSGLFSFGR
ncbi:MAG TPA: hypothetical protein VMW87_11730 [Spirochaetia bacterium]|nr:hypothetical protein [Spirochaetia bacterium]